MFLRFLMNPVRRRWRRTLHNSILRGQLSVDVLRAIGVGVLKDIDCELRRARGAEARDVIRRIKTTAEEATEQVLTSMAAIVYVRLAEGETPARRSTIGIGEYLRWRETMDGLLEQAQRARRASAHLPGAGRDGLKGYVAALAIVVGEALLWATNDPRPLLFGLIALAGGVVLLAEIAFGAGFVVGLLWFACGALVLWKGSVVGAWMLSARPWPALAGLLLVWVLGLLAVRKPYRGPATGQQRNPNKQ